MRVYRTIGPMFFIFCSLVQLQVCVCVFCLFMFVFYSCLCVFVCVFLCFLVVLFLLLFLYNFQRDNDIRRSSSDVCIIYADIYLRKCRVAV